MNTMDSYPVPDRSDYQPCFAKRDEDDQLDLRWAEGTLADGRPFRVECWAQWGITLLTYFFSSRGLEYWDRMNFAELLVEEELVAPLDGYTLDIGARRLTDAAGNDLWSVNVVVGDEEGTYVKDGVPLHSYDRTKE